MIKILSIILVSFSLSGCAVLSWFGKKDPDPVVIKKEEVARTPLNLEPPKPLKTLPPQWIVITPKNAEQVWRDLRDKKVDLVLFAITDDGYEQLALDFAQIRNFIEQQRQIIIQYKKYYEPGDKAPKEEKK